ncbi:peptidase family M13 [Teladorsagia circumcincta]|uniref:Peptidase family M13 n=1 Tax=Teladorsagia circumcincta TaxID=45464 RepID=A0A2G9UBH1_TELCI|nr:peptidase family M13 [Teladorsagia circumcincta]
MRPRRGFSCFQQVLYFCSSQDYPKAYNFAGLGTIAGHELVHGFDDEGVQYDKSGELLCKDWNQCGWMDRRSKKGFRDMAHTQCCPVKEGYVHCANGATTQGENIADIGGVQATYQAYLEYMKKRDEPEKRLPGLEQYTPNQLFWMFYANHWCSNDGAFDISTQLMVDPHSPSSCRVNQVLQDIPGFGQDFGCKMSQKLFPTPDYRCKVWVMS